MRAWLLKPNFERFFPLTFEACSLTRKENQVGVLEMTLQPEMFAQIIYFLNDAMIVFETSDTRLLLDSIWFIVMVKRQGRRLFLVCEDQMRLLTARDVWFVEGSLQANKTEPLDDMMKSVVKDNYIITDVNRVALDLTVAPNVSRADTQSVDMAWKNVLAALHDIAALSAYHNATIIFDILMSPEGDGVFTTWISTRGTDRRQSNIKIGTRYGNLADDPTMIIDYGDMANAVLAVGKGEGDLPILESYKDNLSIGRSKWARREATVSATHTDDTAVIRGLAQAEVEKRKAVAVLEGVIEENDTFRFGRDFDYGDLLTVDEYGYLFDCRVHMITISIDANGRVTRSAAIRGTAAL